MRIYTRTGDGGETGLQGGSRVQKSDPRIAAYGAVDEANSAIGVALAGQVDVDVRDVLGRIQGELFVVGADLSNPDLADTRNRTTPEMVLGLESSIDDLDAELPALDSFVLPGGDQAAAQIHHARAVARRAEALVVLLGSGTEINTNCITYLNRLSDLLFVAARLLNKRRGAGDVPWRP